MTTIKFGDLEISKISQTSGVFTGNNTQKGWKAIGNINAGFGNVHGNQNIYAKNINVMKKKNVCSPTNNS